MYITVTPSVLVVKWPRWRPALQIMWRLPAYRPGWTRCIDQAACPIFYCVNCLNREPLIVEPLGRTCIPDWTLCPSREPLACSLPSSTQVAFLGGGGCKTACVASLCFRRRRRDRGWNRLASVPALSHSLSASTWKHEVWCHVRRWKVFLPDWQVWLRLAGMWTVNRQPWSKGLHSLDVDDAECGGLKSSWDRGESGLKLHWILLHTSSPSVCRSPLHNSGCYYIITEIILRWLKWDS